MTKPQLEHNWFGDLLMKFIPTDVDIEGETPEEMVKNASWKAFTLSTAAALPPGFIGYATILPELIVVTKVQMNLVYSIAKYYGKAKTLNATIVTLIFAHEAGIAIGQSVVKKVGPKLVVRALGTKALRPIAQKIAQRIGARITQRLVGRWIPFLVAPLFGAFSKSMTTRIGNYAIELLREDIEVLETAKCPNGHEVYEDSKFCPECGVSVAGNG